MRNISINFVFKMAILALAATVATAGILLSLSGCSLMDSADEGQARSVITENVWIEHADGTWTKSQVILPENYREETMPLVTLSHGFRGTMNSAGGKELATRLAAQGIATIRMDFSHYTRKGGDTQTDTYTVDTMIEDQLTCIEYMIRHYNIDPKRIGLYGRSLGGRVAMTMANESSGGYSYRAMALVAPAGNAAAMEIYMGGEDAWAEMKAEAEARGSISHQGVNLTPEFFSSIEDYVPSDHGDRFSGPVLVIYNTEDRVVRPEISLECAHSYSNVQITRITSDNKPHSCEMGMKNSAIKEQLMGELVDFFSQNLQ